MKKTCEGVNISKTHFLWGAFLLALVLFPMQMLPRVLGQRKTHDATPSGGGTLFDAAPFLTVGTFPDHVAVVSNFTTKNRITVTLAHEVASQRLALLLFS